MTIKKNTNQTDNNEIRVDTRDSSLAEFVKRPLPTEEEVREFEEIINEEAREDDVEESLNEIYQDDNGAMVDVKKMFVKKSRGFFFYFFIFLFLISGVAAVSYYAYTHYYLKSASDATAVDFFIEGKSDVISGEEFYYTVHYKNSNVVAIQNAKVEISYPKNFIFLDSDPKNESDNKNVWEIGRVGSRESGEIKIKGKILGSRDNNEVVFADFSYEPENFSSNFSKKSSLTTRVKDIGLNLDFDYVSSALINEEEEVVISYSAQDDSFINSFRLTFEPQENVKIIGLNSAKKEDVDKVVLVRPGVWQVNEISKERKELVLKFSFLDKVADSQKLNLILEKGESADRFFEFYRKEMEFEVMKNDLNLSLIVNGSRDDAGVDAGGRLNYSISFVNKGETDMKNVILMAVLDSDFLNWDSLVDKAKGVAKNNTITWSKEQIPELEILKKHEEGVIDFSIDLEKLETVEGGGNYQVKSYAQFSVGRVDDDASGEEGEEGEENEETEKLDLDNKSNIIINKINSDLEFKEYLLYFDQDNIPVGTGPHPPRVGEETSYRVYWDLTNSLHELENLKISFDLPKGVLWKGRDQASVGSIGYDEATNKLVWNIGRLPASIHKANAEFSLGVIPVNDDKNKIMIILPGSSVSATDAETKSNIEQSTKAKTTKLEDDEVASGDGIVE